MIRASVPQIELRHLHRVFNDTHAVNDVSFAVHTGEVFGYIGPNGAGKTTSMRILATLDEPTAGDALVDGFSVVDDPDRVRRRLGFMPDYFGTYQNVNVREYLDFFARAYGLRGTERLRAIAYVMDFTRLDTLANKAIDTLSKGMKQRLCLGRTMIHDPSVLVLDEPAAGLDPRARIELREMIARLAEAGKAILISSHILTELAEICHRVGILEQGRLLAVGSVDEISSHAKDCGQVRIRVLDDTERLVHWLTARDDVADIRVGESLRDSHSSASRRDAATGDGELLTFSHVGDRQSEAALLRAVVEAGFAVVEFGTRHKSLEDVFLHVTEGRVQ